MKGVYRPSRSYLLFTAAIIAAFALFAVLLVIPEIVNPSVEGLPRWFSGIWVAGVIYTILRYFRTAYQIEIRPDGALEFRGLLLRAVVWPTSIIRISDSAWSGGFVTVTHSEGKLLMFRVEGMFEVLSYVKQQNPAIRLKGL